MGKAFVDLLVYVAILTIACVSFGCLGDIASQGCIPTQSCTSQGFQCGTFTDSCGITQHCGDCSSGTCNASHQCSGCVPTTSCGSATCGADSCGTTCGTHNGNCLFNEKCSTTDGTPGTCQTIGSLPAAGNPDGSCTSITIPAEAQPVDTSHPTTVVGSGTAESCTFAALASAVAAGGIITFNCGDEPVTIPVATTLKPPVSNAYAHQPSIDTVIDGGNTIILDGQGSVRILSFVHEGSWQVNNDSLTLQHLMLVNGNVSGTDAFSECNETPNAECPTGFFDGQGGALNMRDGQLRIIDCTFTNNQAELLGPDTGGGAIYVLGTAHPVYIVSSTFQNNTASNAGGIGMLWAGASIFNSLFDGNSAVGRGANSNDPSGCACINNGHNQVGSGGNGGAIYKDGGDNQDVTICGTQIRNNTVNEFGAAVFLTCNGSTAKLVIYDSLMKNNVSPHTYWQWCPGISTDNPHEFGCATCAPSPVNTNFCDADGNCTSSCSS